MSRRKAICSIHVKRPNFLVMGWGMMFGVVTAKIILSWEPAHIKLTTVDQIGNPKYIININCKHCFLTVLVAMSDVWVLVAEDPPTHGEFVA